MPGRVPRRARTCPQEKRLKVANEKKRKGQIAISEGMNEVFEKYQELGKAIKKQKNEVKKQDARFEEDDD